MKKHVYQYNSESQTIFSVEPAYALRLHRLFGLPCAESPSPWVSGFFTLDTDKGSLLFERENPCETEFHPDGFSFTCTDSTAGFKVQSVWTFCSDTGIWNRKDSLTNISDADILILRSLARFSLAPGDYEIYSQSSRWCHESQGHWQPLTHGSVLLSCEGGRTTQGGTPYLCIRNHHQAGGAVFHVIPNGNWVIKASLRTAPGDSVPYAVLEMGLSDEHLRLSLKPGQTVELPEIIVQELLNGQPQYSASRLHRYLLQSSKRQTRLPLVYNTWFDAFGDLKTNRLEQQLAAAKEIGCEVFTVDAGWYGQSGDDWYTQCGDWRERQNGAFYGQMKDFANAVRSAGLGFGLWMEPERFGPDVPIVKLHPDWFIDAKNGYFYPDLCNEAARAYISGEIMRLIESYELVWMKLDFNFDLGIDPTGTEFLCYYQQWYEIIEDVRHQYPQLFLEGCASGAMRLELSSIRHCDAHFLSDTVYPPDVLRIFEGTLLRLLPGHIAKWAVLRSAGNCVPAYGTALEDSPETILVPCGATWEVSQSTNIDFAVFAAMSGVMGFSGDLAGLSAASIARLIALVDFYKQHRHAIYNSAAELLPPLADTSEQHLWQAVQMMTPESSESILFAYRLNTAVDKYTAKPLHLDKLQYYRVAYWDGREIIRSLSGEQLMNRGFIIEISQRFGATAVVIQRIAD